MAYSEKLADRVRRRFENLAPVEEKVMMGGLCFMYNGKMCVGIMKDELMCRVDHELYTELLEKPGARQMDFTGRPLIGYVLVDEAALKTQAAFDYWINLSLEFNPKAKASKKKQSAKKN